MSMVRFAMLCDKCGKRSEEYTPWATCRECLMDFCPACSSENTEDESNRCICHDCKRESALIAQTEGMLDVLAKVAR